MLSLQEELSGKSGTNQMRRAQGQEGSERKLRRDGGRTTNLRRSQQGKTDSGYINVSWANPVLCWWVTAVFPKTVGLDLKVYLLLESPQNLPIARRNL